MNSRAEVSTPYVPVELIGDDKIEQVVLQHVKTEEKIIIDVDDVIVNYGFVSSLGPIKNWGLDIQKQHSRELENGNKYSWHLRCW